VSLKLVKVKGWSSHKSQPTEESAYRFKRRKVSREQKRRALEDPKSQIKERPTSRKTKCKWRTSMGRMKHMKKTSRKRERRGPRLKIR